MKKTYMPWVDFAKGMVMLFVIYEHTSAYNWRIVSLLCSFAMPFYFFISGVLQKPVDEEDYKGKMTKRGKRLLIPHFTYGILLVGLTVVIDWCTGNGVGNVKLNLLGIIYGRTVLFNTTSTNDPSNIRFFQAHDGTLWFLLAMFLVTLAFELIIRQKKQLWAYLILTTLAVFSVACWYLPILLPWSIDTAGVLVVFMLAGYKLKDSISKLKLLPSLLFGIVCCPISYINRICDVSIRRYGDYGPYSVLLFFIIGLSGSICICGIAQAIYNYGLAKLRITKFFEFIGKHSLTFMCTHLLFIDVVKLFMGDMINNRYLLGLAEFVVSISLCLMFSKLIDILKNKMPIFKYL